MDDSQRRVDDIRKERSELENHLIDEYKAGKISRRDFVRRGTVVGMSIPLLGFLAAACGGDDDEEAAPAPPAETGAAPRPLPRRAAPRRCRPRSPAAAPCARRSSPPPGRSTRSRSPTRAA